VFDRALDHAVGIEASWQREPEEEAPLGIRPTNEITQLTAKRLLHDIPLVCVVRAKHRQLAVEDAAAARLVDDSLIQGAGQQILRLFGHLEFRGE